MGKSRKRAKSLTEQFLEVAKPNKNGHSRAVSIEELLPLDEGFRPGNGCSWARSDGALGKKYIIRRERDSKTGAVVSVQLDGFNYNPHEKSIRADILTAVKARKCVVLNIHSNVECDHKNGKYNNRSVGSTETQLEEDFQPLSKAVNDAKRQHCKMCIKHGKRFDATVLGYSVGFTDGDADSPSCPGCYWYDPPAFNKAISEHFKTDK